MYPRALLNNLYIFESGEVDVFLSMANKLDTEQLDNLIVLLIDIKFKQDKLLNNKISNNKYVGSLLISYISSNFNEIRDDFSNKENNNVEDILSRLD